MYKYGITPQELKDARKLIIQDIRSNNKVIKPIENMMTRVVESKMMQKMYKNLDARLADTNNKKVASLLKSKKRLTEGVVALFSVLICQYFIKRL